jgi:Na+-transporting methylmalonyl-CoA/oxaloacetate decarboxylase gamma subunit
MTFGSGPLFLGPDVASWQTVAVVAQPSQPNDNKGGQGEDFGKSSPVGLLVLLLFFIAVAFLVRSMTKHLKRVPASFDKPEDEPAEAEAEAADTDTETDAQADKPADESVEEKK